MRRVVSEYVGVFGRLRFVQTHSHEVAEGSEIQQLFLKQFADFTGVSAGAVSGLETVQAVLPLPVGETVCSIGLRERNDAIGQVDEVPQPRAG